MLEFFRCLAESACEVGVRQLLDDVPGGKFVCGVAERTFEKFRTRVAESKHRAEVEHIARASFAEAGAAASDAVREAVANSGAPADDSDVILLELYLTAVPEAARQSLRSGTDPTGRTAPANFSLRSGADVARLLPVRAPRFRPGAALPGKAGWHLETLLGLGGFGEVWLARHAKMRSLCGAVKFYSSGASIDLAREADLIDRVMHAGSHPNVVPLKYAHLDGPHPWLLFEYVEGGTLAERVHHFAGLPAGERLAAATSALRQVCEAVAFVHGLTPPLVHRDLKPANVLYDRASDRYRVTDFGIGALTAAESLRAETRGAASLAGRLQTELRGSHTPLYASPQQRAGGAPTPQDDVHALGVMAYQMLVGRLDAEVRSDYGRPLNPAGGRAEMIELIGDCCAEDYGDRLGDAGAVLGRLAGKKTVGPPPPSSVPAMVPPPPQPDPQRLTPEQLAGVFREARAILNEQSRPTARQPPPPPTPVVQSPTTLETHYVPLAGTWFSRPVNQPEAHWKLVCSTPSAVEISSAEVFHFSAARSVTDDDFIGLAHLTGLTNLTSLELSGCGKVTDVGVSRMAAHLTSLIELHLNGCKLVTDVGVSQIVGKLTGLMTLGLPNCRLVTDAGVAEVAARLTRLTELDLIGCKLLTDAGVSQVAARLTGLTSLLLGRCRLVTDLGVLQLSRLSKLRSLDLFECPKVTASAVDQLRTALPKCKVTR